jgi:hypothetical protein
LTTTDQLAMWQLESVGSRAFIPTPRVRLRARAPEENEMSEGRLPIRLPPL